MNTLNEKGLELVLSRENLEAAYLQVKRNRGASGVDGIGVDALAEHVRKHWARIREKLESGSYQPSPVKVVKIPKPGGGERELGIPTTTDRLIQQALSNELSKVFEPLFHPNSYGYRPGRSAHDAVRQMKAYVAEGRRWVIDIDIKGFFDHVDHDLLMREVRATVRSKEVLKLIFRYLRAGKLGPDNRKIKTFKGMPQGGPLSPLLSNIYLTVLDEELANRKVAFIRYADDLTIYAKSERSAMRIYESLKAWINRHLKLEVNEGKSGPRRPDEGSFLGFRIEKDDRIALSDQSIQRHKGKVRELLNAQRPWSWVKLCESWNRYIRGWVNYFKLSEWYELGNLSGWIRRHWRKYLWLRWHNYKGRQNAFVRLNVPGWLMKHARSSRGAWRMSAHAAMQRAVPNARLKSWGILIPSDLVEAMN